MADIIEQNMLMELQDELQAIPGGEGHGRAINAHRAAAKIRAMIRHEIARAAPAPLDEVWEMRQFEKWADDNMIGTGTNRAAARAAWNFRATLKRA